MATFGAASSDKRWSARNEMKNPFMARAIELSLENVKSGRGGPFAAVVVKDGKIVAEGTAREIVTRFGQADLEEVFLKIARESR